MRELRLTWLWFGVGWLLVAIVIWLSLTAAPPPISADFEGADKIGHWLAYFVLAGWFVQLYHSWRPRLLYGVLFLALAIGLEFVQEWGGVRAFEIRDMIAGALGVFMGLALGLTPFADALHAIEQRLGHRRSP